VKPRVYLETTIVSYLTSRESSELLLAAHQEATKDWWNDHRVDYELYVSEAVVVEAGGGDPQAAQDYLLTWNCRHIANATIRHRIEGVCRSGGYEPPTICTLLELMYGGEP